MLIVGVGSATDKYLLVCGDGGAISQCGNGVGAKNNLIGAEGIKRGYPPGNRYGRAGCLAAECVNVVGSGKCAFDAVDVAIDKVPIVEEISRGRTNYHASGWGNGKARYEGNAT